MPALPARRLASSALCAMLLLGIAAPAALADEGAPQRGRAHAAAPDPGVDGLLSEVTALAGLGGVLTPVTDLLGTVLTADGGRLSDDETTELTDAAKTAIAEIAEETATSPTADGTAAGTATPDADDLRAEDAADVEPLLAKLQTGLDALSQAIDAGEYDKVQPAAADLVTGLVDVVVSTGVGKDTAASGQSGLPGTSTPTDLPNGSAPPRTGLLSLLGLGAGA